MVGIDLILVSILKGMEEKFDFLMGYGRHRMAFLTNQMVIRSLPTAS